MVPKISAENKRITYQSIKGVTGLKVDVRFIIDCEHEEYDVGVAEICLSDCHEEKIRNDESNVSK